MKSDARTHTRRIQGSNRKFFTYETVEERESKLRRCETDVIIIMEWYGTEKRCRNESDKE